jgi:hypothetical protein
MRPVRTRWRANRHPPLAAARRHRLRAHVSAPVDHEGRAKPPLAATEPIKPPTCFPRAPEQHHHPPPPAIGAAGDLATLLAPVANRQH